MNKILFSVFIFISITFLNGCDHHITNKGILAKVKIDDKYGFINENEKFVIKPNYTMAYSFSEGLALFVKGGKRTGNAVFGGLYGFIDVNGNEVIEPKYYSAKSFKEGYAVVEYKWNKFGFINQKGELIKGGFSELYPFNNGLALALIKKENKIGYIDKKGEFLFSYDFNNGETTLGTVFSKSGLGIIVKKDKNNLYYGYVNNLGEIVIPQKYIAASHFHEDIAFVRENNKEIIAINPKGEILFKKPYFNITDFKEGVATAYYDGKAALIDKKGEIIIPFKYSEIGQFYKGIAFYKKDNLYGFINKNGEILIEAKYKYVSPMNMGYSAVLKEDKKVKIIDSTGKEITKKDYELAQTFIKVSETNINKIFLKFL